MPTDSLKLASINLSRAIRDGHTLEQIFEHAKQEEHNQRVWRELLRGQVALDHYMANEAMKR